MGSKNTNTAVNGASWTAPSGTQTTQTKTLTKREQENELAKQNNYYGYGSLEAWRAEEDKMQAYRDSAKQKEANAGNDFYQAQLNEMRATQARLDQDAKQRAALEAKQQKLDATKARNDAAWKAGDEARQAITQEQASLVRQSGKLLTDFERQEKIRLMKSKTGVGQVKPEDELLSEADRLKAKANLAISEDEWESRRNDAFKKAQEKYLSANKL